MEFDDCVLKQSLSSAPCRLPFQNSSHYSSNIQMNVCQSPEAGYVAFQQFQMISNLCKPACTQLSIKMEYSLPQFLTSRYLPNLNPDSIFAYYLFIPSQVKVSTSSPSYGFISYIAEVAGWYNLFLGGSVLVLWEVLCVWLVWALVKMNINPNNLTYIMKVIFLIAAFGVLVYVLTDSIIMLLGNPVATSTKLRPTMPGISLSICLPQYTSKPSQTFTSSLNSHEDVARTEAFWIRGNNLSNKISELSIKKMNGEVVTLWNRSVEAVSSSLQNNKFKIVNLINSDMAVDFCHTLDLSALSYEFSEIIVKAVNDIKLGIHLAGQLLQCQSFYAPVNAETAFNDGYSLFVYKSEVKFQLEETTFQNIQSDDCVQYNETWTFDDCLLDSAFAMIESKKDLLNILLRPRGSKIEKGIERSILQSLYAILLSQKRQKTCKSDCRSLVVRLMADARTARASPESGIKRRPESVPVPLPPIDVNVNLTLPKLNKVNEVRIS